MKLHHSKTQAGKIYLWLMTALLAPAWQGCHHSEEPEPPVPEHSFISFFASDSLAREATTTLSIPDFSLTAYTKESNGSYRELMNNVLVTRTGLNSWSYSPPVKWPGTPVDFFAVSPASIGIVNNQWWYHTIDFSDPKAETDLLISVNMDVKQTSGRIRLNFRHALAEVNVNLRTSRTDVIIEVRRVSFRDIAMSGRFHYPNTTTDTSFGSHSLYKYWTSYNMSNTDLTLFHTLAATKAIIPNETPQAVAKCGKYMLPIEFSPLQMDGYIHGSRLELLLRFVDPDTGNTLWPNEKTPQILLGEARTCGLACFSLQNATPDGHWYPGVDYTYTININDYPTVISASRSDQTTISCETNDCYLTL